MSAKRKRMIPEFGQIWDPAAPVQSHHRFGNLWIAWMFWMFALDDAQMCLGERETHRIGRSGDVVMPAILAVRAMLLGYAVECGLKALWLRQGNQLISGGKYRGVKGAPDHNLVRLANTVGFVITSEEEAVLSRLSRFARFAGRYPVAKTPNEMQPDTLTEADAGFFSKRDFRISESVLNKLRGTISGKKRSAFPRRPRKIRLSPDDTCVAQLIASVPSVRQPNKRLQRTAQPPPNRSLRRQSGMPLTEEQTLDPLARIRPGFTDPRITRWERYWSPRTKPDIVSVSNIMRYALFSDIHGNLSALMSVLRDARQRGGFDQIWCIGDIVGYGPEPNECIKLLRDYDHLCVAGNHDWGAVGKADLVEFNADAAAACQWTAEQLDITSREYLSSLPLKQAVGEFTMVHGSLRDPIWEYLTTATVAQRNADRLKTEYCIVGHTHVPLVFECGGHGCLERDLTEGTALKIENGKKLFINPGSVGQPRDGDPMASYAIYDSDAGAISHYRVRYNIAATQKKMEECGLPFHLIDRLSYGR